MKTNCGVSFIYKNYSIINLCLQTFNELCLEEYTYTKY
jgi:hypothetical protein